MPADGMHGFADLHRGDIALPQTNQSSQSQDVGKAERPARRQKILLFPAIELTLGNA
jgi:hypothetical protein